MSSNKLVVCPYDEAHKVKESRIQIHIAKCRQNHLDKAESYVCHFNATHVLPKQEKDYHLSRCPDRAMLDRIMSVPVNQNNPFKGRTAVPSYSEALPVDSSEVWDIEDECGYQPTKEVPTGAIVQPKPMSKPAIRRQLYRDLHQWQSDYGTRSDSATIHSPVPRQPKQPSEAERTFEEQGANLQYSGLGRGKTSASRIAANFSQPPKVNAVPAQTNTFSQQPKVNSAPAQNNYSAAISGMKNLGLGRGVSAPSNQVILNDDDFPALGVGRGVARNPQRQEIKAHGPR